MKNMITLMSCLFVFYSCANNSSSSENNHSKDSGTVTSRQHETAQPQPAAVSPDYLILPGKSIGKTFLEEDAETLTSTLGKPDFSDAAMGKAWLIWFGNKPDEHNNKTELDVYITYKDSTMSSKVIKQIRTTSSAFKINDSLHVYSELSTIRRFFPDIRFTEKYQDDSRQISIYDDIKQGIAFDVAMAGNQQICIGITVHPPGKSVSDVYIRLQPHGNKK